MTHKCKSYCLCEAYKACQCTISATVCHTHSLHKMRSITAVLVASMACLIGEALSSPLVPAYLDTDTGDVLVRMPRQTRLNDDLITAADTSYSKGHKNGRVKIQVYRGPSKGEGYDVFAPWGYYNTQPADKSYH